MINIIAAIQKKDRGLGYQGDLLYSVTEDMKHFREITAGSVVIMGRKTWESLPEKFRPLPNRDNIVVTRNEKYTALEATVVHSFDEALQVAQKFSKKEIFVIGGGEIYKQALPQTDRLYLTLIDGNREADVFFPEYSEFNKILSEKKSEDPKTGLDLEYLTLAKEK